MCVCLCVCVCVCVSVWLCSSTLKKEFLKNSKESKGVLGQASKLASKHLIFSKITIGGPGLQHYVEGEDLFVIAASAIKQTSGEDVQPHDFRTLFR